MFDKLKAYIAGHEPTAEEAIIAIRHLIKFLTPTEMAELKMIIAALDVVDKVVDAVVINTTQTSTTTLQ